MQIPEAFRDNYLFRGLTEKNIDDIMSITSTRSCLGGDTIIRQFGDDLDIMVILKGLAQVKAFSGEVIAEVGPGFVLGEVSLIDDAPRSATVVSKGATEFAVIDGEKLRTLLGHDVGMRAIMFENLAKLLCVRLRVANVHLDAMPAGARR